MNLSRQHDLALTPAFYSSLVRHGSELITVLSQEGIYQYVSDSISTVLGYDTFDLLGTNVLDLVHPDDLPPMQVYLHELVSGQELQIEVDPFRFLAKDGSWHWLSCVATNMLDNPNVRGIVTNSRDVTTKMEALQQKKVSQAYYKALYFNNPDLVFTLNMYGQVESCNDAVFGITGYTRVESPETYFSEFVLPEYRQDAWGYFSKAITGHPCTFDTCIRHKQGDIRHLRLTLVPVLLEGKVQAIQCVAKDVTSEMKANLLVKQQAQNLHNILESITEAFFALDSEWRYTFGNSVYARFVGRSKDELMHRCIWEVLPWAAQSLFYQQCHAVVSTGQPASFSEYYSHLNATLRFSINPFDGGVSVTFVDITRELAAQEELSKLSLVASKTTNGVIITDKDGVIEWVNESFTAVSGYSLEEIIGRRPSEILVRPDFDPRDHTWIREQLAKGIPVRKELLGYKKCGALIWADTSISPVKNDNGNITKHVYIHTDITERKNEQEQLLKATEHLHLQNQDLQQFNYIVSHNLRAPVANLLGLSSMLQKMDRTGSRFETGLQNLERSARRLDDVINDLNKILAVRASNTDDAREQVGLRTVTGEVIQSLQYLLDQVDGRVVVNMTEDDVLWANRAYIYSIMHNLLSNAIKYKSADRNLLIEINSVRKGNGLLVSVKDNGSGMDLELVKPRLFQLYKRFHTGYEGKGIGLYLVKMQVEAIGGSIEVDSEVSKGTLFTLYFGGAAYGQ